MPDHRHSKQHGAAGEIEVHSDPVLCHCGAVRCWELIDGKWMCNQEAGHTGPHRNTNVEHADRP